jgi:hypothetical protein
LVPADQLIFGQPISGWPLPGVALQDYVKRKQVRTHDDTIELWDFVFVIESSTEEEVLDIESRIIGDLLPFSVGARTAQELFNSELRVTRDPTSENYVGTLTLSCHVW